MKRITTKTILSVIGVLLGLFVLIQLIPYGRNHTNPPVKSEPAWDSPQTKQLVETACYDCHSNQTTWPWYSNIAPASWLVYSDVQEARGIFNFNELQAGEGAALVGDMVEKIQTGKMPPIQFSIIHRNAVYSAEQKQQLIDGLQATFK
jgi:hypothetical protein